MNRDQYLEKHQNLNKKELKQNAGIRCQHSQARPQGQVQLWKRLRSNLHLHEQPVRRS